MKVLLLRTTSLALMLFVVLGGFAQETLPADTRKAIDSAVMDVLGRTGAPSASIAVVKDGKLAYTRAYGNSTLSPAVAATPEMRYSIGSISKQFTAAAILLLAEEGKLSLDDRVVRWLPELSGAKDITLRHLLSMTSGYQDFWPQDYVMPMMMNDIEPRQIVSRWAKIPLDFEPGTKWQYSNTNYVLAGMIAEEAAKMSFMDYLTVRIFRPLQMTSVYDTDKASLPPEDASRYRRFGLGPARPAPKEGAGWMFAAGQLAMTARDLATWDISLINQSLLAPSSYRELMREMQLTTGLGTRYGLGVSVTSVDGRRVIAHGGEVSGFTAQNQVFPDDKAAVVVFTNLDATNASEQIATRVARALFATNDPATPAALEQARSIFAALQQGRIDRSLFSSNANAYFSDAAVADFAASLGPLGKPQEFVQQSQSLRGGMTLRRYRVVFPKKTLRVWTFTLPDGKLEQYMVAAAE